MEEDRKTWPKDVVVIHQFPRGGFSPSNSPFPLKVETFCRMAKIPHVGEFKYSTSKKGKSPWITFNGEDVADSSFIIEFLNKKFEVDLKSHLTPAENAAGLAFQRLIEDSLYWALVYDRWCVWPRDQLIARVFPQLTPEMAEAVGNKLKEQLNGQGLGRHSDSEVLQIGKANLTALRDFLGQKKYLLGDRVSEYDATMFGSLVQIYPNAHPTSPYTNFLKEECKNLVEYVDRMKAEFWIDWDDFHTHNHTRAAKK